MNISWQLSELSKVEKKPIKVMSTFSCGGGSSMGYKLNGFDVIAANDIDPEMQYHYIQNLKPKHYFLCPVNSLIKQKLPKELFNLDILDGSPPCSTFSMAGNREKDWGVSRHFQEGQAKQVLSDLFFDFIELADHLRPKVIIAENVKGMIMGNAKGYVKKVKQKIMEAGYTCQIFLVNAADCGVPQNRQRIFFCCLRNDIVKPKLKLIFNQKKITVSEAFKGVQNLTPLEVQNTKPYKNDLKYYHHTPMGQNYEKAAVKLEMKKKNWSFIRLHKDKPSNTVTAASGTLKHYSECRSLTFREFKRLGSFPDDYKAKTDKIGKYMVGMSVPPFMTQQISLQIYKQWLQNENSQN